MLGEQIKKQLTELNNFQEPVTVASEEFTDIELDEYEVKEALRKARQTKFTELKRAEYWEEMNRKTTQVKPNARELYERLLGTKSKTNEYFEVTDWNKHVVFGLCLYFAGDPKFEDKYGSLKKGIFLQGPQGTGKTHLMIAFAINPQTSYRNVTTKQVAEHYAQTDPKFERGGLSALDYYSISHKPTLDIRDIYQQDVFGFCFGDLGTEAVRKNYGNETNVMEHVVFQRYENGVPFNQTHFTTNMNGEEIEQTYGIRVRDRLSEMCNVFALNGPSWRK